MGTGQLDGGWTPSSRARVQLSQVQHHISAPFGMYATKRSRLGILDSKFKLKHIVDGTGLHTICLNYIYHFGLGRVSVYTYNIDAATDIHTFLAHTPADIIIMPLSTRRLGTLCRLYSCHWPGRISLYGTISATINLARSSLQAAIVDLPNSPSSYGPQPLTPFSRPFPFAAVTSISLGTSSSSSLSSCSPSSKSTVAPTVGPS